MSNNTSSCQGLGGSLYRSRSRSVVDHTPGSGHDPELAQEHESDPKFRTGFQVPHAQDGTEMTTRTRSSLTRDVFYNYSQPTDAASQTADRYSSRPRLSAPLKLQTMTSSDSQVSSLGQMPTYREPPASLRHAGSSGTTSSIGLRSESSMDDRSASPKAERLPSFRQLSKAAAAGEEDSEPAPTTYPAPITYPATIPSQSPVIPPQTYPQPPQISPIRGYPYSFQPSSGSVQSDARDPYYANSPPPGHFSASNYYAHQRRNSVPHRSAPALPVSLTSASSSGESYGQQSSGTEGYSTAHTTPIESSLQSDISSRPTLPLLPHMHSSGSGSGSSVQGSFTCDYPGCNAAPFQTQYLLK